MPTASEPMVMDGLRMELTCAQAGPSHLTVQTATSRTPVPPHLSFWLDIDHTRRISTAPVRARRSRPGTLPRRDDRHEQPVPLPILNEARHAHAEAQARARRRAGGAERRSRLRPVTCLVRQSGRLRRLAPRSPCRELGPRPARARFQGARCTR
jgi:hypothetical protein